MKIRFKKIHPQARDPERAHNDDAGFDLRALSQEWSVHESEGLYTELNTGIAFEIPKGYVGLLFPRSSISKTNHMLRNSVGVVDSGYRGAVKFRFTNDVGRNAYKIGDKIGQIVFLELPEIHLELSENLAMSKRDLSGFGSSGK